MNTFSFSLTGCWNYKEIDQLAIVAGVTIDKAEDNKLLVTTELVNVKQEQKQSTVQPVYMQTVGDSFFDTSRKMISYQGKRLYWSHAKVAVISEEIAKNGINKVLDFMNRDTEVREDMWVLIAKGSKAYEIFNAKPEIESIISFQLDNTLRAQKAVSRYPSVELYEFIDKLAYSHVSTVVPTVSIVQDRGKPTAYVSGGAVIKGNKSVGYLDPDEIKSLLWITDELKGGLYIINNVGKTKTNVTLEIFKSKTKIKPEIIDGKLVMKVSVMIDVNIGEIMGNADFISKEGRGKLKQDAEKQIKADLEKLIEKAKKEYKTDFLGFSEKVKQTMPKAWKEVGAQWEDYFEDMTTIVNVDVRIKGSASTREPLKVEE